MDFSKFTPDTLATMLATPALKAHHDGIVAHLESLPTGTPAPKSTPKPKKAEKTYTVDEGKVEEDINNYVSGAVYSKGYLRLKPKNRNGVVMFYKEDIAALEAFIKANRKKFKNRPTK